MVRPTIRRLAAAGSRAAAAGMSTAEAKRPSALFSLEGKTALVTGGSQGLGKAIARGLALAGANVVVASRREVELKAALAEVTAGTHVRGQYIVADLGKAGEAERLGKEALAWAGGHVDVLVNNAGISSPGAIHKGTDATEGIPPMTLESWESTLEVNLSSAVKLTNALAPSMVQKGWGRVINISSIGGLGSSEGRTSYSATKAALHAISWAGAIELGPHGVTVNAIAPGPFLTEMPLTKLPKATIEAVGAKVPLKRWGEPDELVGPVLMLASEAGSYVNGAVLRVDGGLLARAY